MKGEVAGLFVVPSGFIEEILSVLVHWHLADSERDSSPGKPRNLGNATDS
jgi:hypothetical protein